MVIIHSSLYKVCFSSAADINLACLHYKLICSADASLNNPLPQTADFVTAFFVTVCPNRPSFSRHLQQVNLYGPIYLAPSGVIRSFHRQFRPFTTNGSLLPMMGHLPSCPPGQGSSGWFGPALLI